MADHMAAEIWIGGRIPASLTESLCTAIAEQGVSLEWGEARFVPGTREDLLGACRDQDGVSLLLLCDDEARWRELEELEQFLRDNNIAYTRRSDGVYEHDPEMVEFRPGRGVFLRLTNKAGQPVVPASMLAEIDSALSQVLELPEQASRQDISLAVHTARRLLRERLPPAMPPLKPLEIVEGEL